ncbi:major facilitator superfamily domain-containing protein [Penicillium concentricum]|uniref:Major facilitator superfamily domain-containing protein n=1 Tax=Penicillium concentricum TaxID=293559 RepID=A0A9W9RBJ5_9EURO|nr:major facilitator superfamily domain-containing protein [Penicillium concentricum]KAJ5356264.1 major facilitator superfamily domain-containing protein [Penicillium concentricum]
MMSLMRDAPIGQLIRFVTRNRVLLYPDELPDFQCPPSIANTSSAPSVATLTYSNHDVEAATSGRPEKEAAPSPFLVDWYGNDDVENPQNWSGWRKGFVTFQICIYTLAVYMGSAIYTPSAPGVMEYFGVSEQVASLGLSLYVLAYGMGPLIFSPLSEIPAIGRNWPYIVTMIIFVVLCVPTALVDNIGGLLVLRFLQGFFGSPALATGAASLADIYPLMFLPYALCLWALAATSGPALGPVISGFSVPAESWRWSLWEILWLAGPVLLVMILFLPETSSHNILLRRAKRLRKLTGNSELRSLSELIQARMTAREVAFEALVRPMQLMIMDPAIGYTAVYAALCYAIYYSFFEVFPMVYIELYGFNVGEMGLTFLSITVGTVVSIAGYYAYFYWIVTPAIISGAPDIPEYRLIPALFSSFLLPIGLFIFAWTGNGHTHWIVSVIGIFLFTVGMFLLMQSIFAYLPAVYPQYTASTFAGNDFARSSLAFAAVMFSRPMYRAMGIGPGTSLLAALTAACIVGIFILFFYGEKLRARSRFSAKY